MPDNRTRHCRIALLARPAHGLASLSWRIKDVLEARGHTVFFFSPATHPFAFDAEGVARPACLQRFCVTQQLDCVLMADGVLLSLENREMLAKRTAVGLVCDSMQVAKGYAQALTGARVDFALVTSERIGEVIEAGGIVDVVELCPAAVDDEYANTPLANTIAYGPGILCLQDATESHIAYLRRYGEENPGEAVRCVGEGWPEEWRISPTASGFAYASRSSHTVMVFDEEEGESADALQAAEESGLLALALHDGNTLMRVTGGTAEPLPYTTNAETFDTTLIAAWERIRAQLAPRALMPGTEAPRRIVAILGYVGKGNFGDEYILATLDQLIRSRFPGASVVAISEDPAHTLQERGIYAISLRDTRMLAGVLDYASAALVIAGLLFDQGTRWTMGKAEFVSTTSCSDIPGIANYVSLATLSGAQPVLYGIGAGPLALADSQRLVNLMARLGARFIARDAETAQLIRACDVPESLLIQKADTAFLGACERTAAVDAWLEQTGFQPDTHRLIAVSLRDYDHAPQDFAERVAAALDAVARSHEDVRFALCVLDPADRTLAQRVQANLHNPTTAALFDEGDRNEAVADLLARAHAGLSMRYHCSLLLNNFGKPCVGIDYLPKVAALYHDMGCDDLLLPMDAEAADIERTLLSLLESYEARSAAVQENAERLRHISKEAEDLLADIIEEVGLQKEGALARAFYLYDEPASELRRRQREADLTARLRETEHTAQTLTTENAHLVQELESLTSSKSYKLGWTLMRLPSRLKATLKCHQH